LAKGNFPREIQQNHGNRTVTEQSQRRIGFTAIPSAVGGVGRPPPDPLR